ncbi:MAG: acetyl-CoA carboxylase biotin carboxyl carrier protein subunit, partial [Pseudobdellovibrionaceae bacterium]
MYFEAELNNKKYKVDVIETRSHWKIAIQEEGKDWQNHNISKSDYKKAESYWSFLFKGSSYLVDVIGSDTNYSVFTRSS